LRKGKLTWLYLPHEGSLAKANLAYNQTNSKGEDTISKARTQ